MLSFEERDKLGCGVDFKKLLLPPLGCDNLKVGFDCEGKILRIGDRVEVVKPNLGKGKIKRWCGGWLVVVDFGDEGTGVCADYHLRKI